MSYTVYSENQWQALEALHEAVLPGVSPQAIGLPDNDISRKWAETPLNKLPDYRERVASTIVNLPHSSRKLLYLVTFALSHRSLAFTITGSHKLLTEMTLAERENLLLGLRDARIAKFHALFKSTVDFAMLTFVSTQDTFDLFNLKFPNPALKAIYDAPAWVVPIRQIPAVTKQEIEVDVVLTGSGSSGVVAARRLALLGFKVLILEKGRQVFPKECHGPPGSLEPLAYEASNRLFSDDAGMLTMVGSTLGGGGAVNWSCSLKTPLAVRRQWAEKGADFWDSPVYDDALDHVYDIMGVRTLGPGEHSFTNDLILKGSEKLNYPAISAPQNTGTHVPNNHFLGYGYRHGAGGGVTNWLKDAVDAGAEVITNARVLKIIHSHGKATGVHAFVNGTTHLYVKAKKVVVCGGSMSTPGQLLRSGFRNSNIGKGLKLHPVTVAYGDFDEKVNRQEDTIMTAVCGQSANFDGNHFGARIEAIHHQPALLGKFIPWNSGTEFKSLLARYEHLSSLLVITRDRGGRGRVFIDPKEEDPLRVNFKYVVSKFDLEALRDGCITAADLLYVQGAKRIFLGNVRVPIFDCSNAPNVRRVTDPAYKAWVAKVRATSFELFDTSVGSAHQMASCRMSRDGPSYGVVDTKGRLFECSNVHIIDTSVFPSASGVNPMISCMATAHVLAGYVADELSAARL